MAEIVVKLPDKTTPGYLRRLMVADGFREKMNVAGNRAEFYESLIEFLLVYVIEPEDRNEARELLLEATEEQYRAMLAVIHGGGATNPTQAEPSEMS